MKFKCWFSGHDWRLIKEKKNKLTIMCVNCKECKKISKYIAHLEIDKVTKKVTIMEY